jgi:integrase
MAKRRANGEGTISRRKDGRYEAAAWVTTTSGIRKRVRRYSKTHERARELLVQIVAKNDQGIPVPDKSWRMSEYLGYWLEYGVGGGKRSHGTYSRHEGIVRLYLKPGIGRYSLDQLSVVLVQDFLDHLSASGKPPATVHQVRKSLSAALTYAMRKELVLRNVARLADLPRYEPREGKHWAPEEITQFLGAAQNVALYPAFVLLVLYGLRLGEVLGLRWCDVDFDQGILRIRQQIQLIKGELQEVPLKTKSSRRDEPLLAAARDILRKQYVKQANLRAIASEDWHGAGTDKELVFTTRTGRPVEPRNLYRSFMSICSQHNIRRIKVHELRHTNATVLKNLNVPGRDIQAILGHSNIRTTGIYEHTDMARKQDALQKVEVQFFGELTAARDSGRSRQPQPSNATFAENFTILVSGGPSGIRTHDTRLKRAVHNTVSRSMTEVIMASRARYWMSLVGGVAVAIAVRQT